MARGLVWAYLTFAGTKALVFAVTVVLARLLTPADFGIVGFATIVTDYLGALRHFGVGQALIQRKTKIEQAANATFLISLVSGFFLAALALALAPVTASFFNEPRVLPLLAALSLTYIISAFGSVNDALLVKNLDFQHRLIPDVTSAVVKGGSSIALAFAGFGVWSLVLGQLLGTLASTLTLWWIYPWRPTRVFDLEAVREIFGFGSQMVLLNFISNIEINVDYIIVGRRLGSTALGLYTMAFRLPELLIVNLVSVVADVIFPAYAKIQEDRHSLQNNLLETMRYVAMAAVPLGVGLAMLSGPFIETFYTDKWSGAIQPMQILAIYALLRAVIYNVGDVYKAVGRPDILNKLTFISLVMIVPALWIGADYGAVGVSLAHATVALINLLLKLYTLWRLLDVPPWVALRAMSGSIVSALGMALAIQGAALLARGMASLWLLLLLFAVGAATYTACTVLLNRSAIQAALPVMRRALGMKAVR